MPSNIKETIRNLEFIKDSFARKINKIELLESEKKVNDTIRTTLASLQTISRKHKIPELKILADKIYHNIAPKPEKKWRKRIYLIFGVIFITTLSIFLEQAVTPNDSNVKEISEEEKKLREAYIYANSAIKILKKVQNIN